jgi:alkylated DNA repair dioxygenase AlkB
MRQYKWKLGEGEVIYIPDWLENPDLFLGMESYGFTPEKVKMYGRSLVLTRQTANHGLPYTYNVDAKPPTDWTQPALEIKKRLEAMATGHVFQQCANNYYPDGTINIGLHVDKATRLNGKLVKPNLIASVSIGAERVMGWARFGDKQYDSKPDPSLPLIALKPGSLVLFDYRVNAAFKHTILKDKSVTDSRISLTLREF